MQNRPTTVTGAPARSYVLNVVVRPWLVVLFLASCNPETSPRNDAALTDVKTVDCAAVTPTATVTTLGLAYDPTPTTIPVGGVVKFAMPAQHNVASPTSGLAVDYGGTRCLQFPSAGTFTFKCASHGFMGTVVVADTAPKGPGAALHCQSSATGANAWDTYGVNAFVAVNEEIFALVTAELDASGAAHLGDSLSKVGTAIPPAASDDFPTFKGKLAAFLVYAYGGPSSITYTDGKIYSGLIDMVAAHTGFGITAAQLDYFIANIVVPALIKTGVKHGAGTAADPDDVASCFAPVVTSAAFKASIVGR